MPESAHNRKAIVVGANSPYCASVKWSQINLRNLVDYDLAILIVRDLDKGAAAISSQVLGEVNQQLGRLLDSGGQLVIATPGIYPFKLRHSPQNAKEVGANLRSILPIPINFRAEPGNTVIRNDGAQFSSYLRRIQSWTYWASITGEGSTETAYLSNREGRTIAGYFAVGTKGITLLPDIPNRTTDQIASEILEELGFREQSEPAPDWAEKVAVPGIGEIEAAITECRVEISEASERLGQLDRDRAKLAKYRMLLYSTGDDLEEVVSDVLQQLGAEVLDERHGVEDSLIKIGEETCVVEVTGTDGPLKLLKVRQLLDHAMIVEDQTGNRPKAILVANPLKKMPPDLRSSSKAPEFPQNVVTRTEESKIALVSGKWLFHKYCEVLDGTVEAKSVLDNILKTDGLVD